jgi:hypothetical protein
MGADYCWTFVRVPSEYVETIFHSPTIDVDGYRNYLRKHVALADIESMRSLLNDERGIDANDLPTDRDVTSMFYEAIENVVAISRYHSRESQMSTIDGTTIIHTGGPSWGDPPTNDWDSIGLVNLLLDGWAE